MAAAALLRGSFRCCFAECYPGLASAAAGAAGLLSCLAPQARYLQPLMVLDTYSALGRRNLIGAGIVVWWMILRESSDGATEI